MRRRPPGRRAAARRARAAPARPAVRSPRAGSAGCRQEAPRSTCRAAGPRRATPSLGLTAVVLLVVGAVSTIARIPPGGELYAQTSWRGLLVAPEQRCSPYDADDYRSVEDRIVDDLGGVYGQYTGRWFASESDTDIEHMVARSEAHDSGLCAADLATRHRFATDLLNRTLAGPRVNRYEKVDRDAAEWLPAQNRCWFAARVIAVRQRYGLTTSTTPARNGSSTHTKPLTRPWLPRAGGPRPSPTTRSSASCWRSTAAGREQPPELESDVEPHH